MTTPATEVEPTTPQAAIAPAPVADAPLAVEAQATPPSTDPATGITSEKPAPAETTPVAKAPDPELIAIQQRIARIEQENTELRRLAGERSIRETIASNRAELEQYKAGLEKRGFDEQTVAELVGERSRLQNERLQVRQQAEKYQADFRMAQESARATEIVVNQLSERYGMPVAELHKLRNTVVEVQGQARRPFDDPWILEANARAYKAEQELVKLKGGQVNPTKLATVQSSAAGAGSYPELLKSGKPLPSAAEIDRLTARYVTG